jgi:hypothetical protein
MTRQTKRPGGVEMDLSLLSPCPVDAGWYERYWYVDNSPLRLSIGQCRGKALRRVIECALGMARRLPRCDFISEELPRGSRRTVGRRGRGRLTP